MEGAVTSALRSSGMALSQRKSWRILLIRRIVLAIAILSLGSAPCLVDAARDVSLRDAYHLAAPALGGLVASLRDIALPTVAGIVGIKPSLKTRDAPRRVERSGANKSGCR